MNAIKIDLLTCLSVFCFWGCTSAPKQLVPATECNPQYLAETPQSTPKQKPRVWSDKQLNLLRSFALAESPKLWQTVQALRAEHEMRTAALSRLRSELVDFGRNPDTDHDYVSLKASNDRLLESVNTIYAKMEDAYIAYKKFQATPGRKEYGNMMKRALEEGLLEADSAVAKYRTMSKEK